MATDTLPAANPTVATPTDGRRFVAIRADLMPDEIIRSRRTERVRRRVLLALAALAILLTGGYGLSLYQTSNAHRGLDALARQNAAMINEQAAFGPLVRAQGLKKTIDAQLSRLMVGDLSWKAMLATLRAKATDGIALTEVTGTVTAGAAAAGGPSSPGGIGALNLTGQQQVGTLTVSGSARDKRSVADYADRLGQVKGLTAPFISTVTALGAKVTFTINVLITSDALGGRYSTTGPTIPGGK